MEIVWKFLTDFVAILCEMAPYLLIGFAFAGLLYAFMPKKAIRKYFGGSPFGASARAAMLGVPLPLCSCGVIPTSMALYKNGASKGSTVSFLISTPQTGADSILATYSMMGLPFAIIRPLTAFVTGIIGGWIEGIFGKRDSHVTGETEIPHHHNDKHSHAHSHDENYFNEETEVTGSFGRRIVIALKYGFHDFLGDIAKWLMVGLVLAAAISALIPKDFITGLNLPVIVQILLMLAVAIPLYVCATGSIPLAATFIAIGVNPGAAFVFLMAGPATSIASITVLHKLLGFKTLVRYLISIICGATISGLIIAYALPAEWFKPVSAIACGDCHATEQISMLSIVCGIILSTLIIIAFVTKHIQSQKIRKQVCDIQKPDSLTATLKVRGMTCSHCKANVEKAASAVEGVDSAIADLASGTLTVCGHSFDIESVKQAVEASGFIIDNTN